MMTIASRLERMLERIKLLEHAIDIDAVLQTLADEYGLASYTYYAFSLPGDGKPFLATKSPNPWVDHYFARDYLPVDPILQQMRRSLLPVDWSEVERTNEFTAHYFQEANNLGMSKNGLTIPIRSLSGEMAMMSISSDMATAEWRSVRNQLMVDFQFYANAIHARMIIISNASVRGAGRNLSKRELQCLTWAAHGKTNEDIATILAISERVVRGYIENARRKLNATNRIQAVVKAIGQGLIRPEAT